MPLKNSKMVKKKEEKKKRKERWMLKSFWYVNDHLYHSKWITVQNCKTKLICIAI